MTTCSVTYSSKRKSCPASEEIVSPHCFCAHYTAHYRTSLQDLQKLAALSFVIYYLQPVTYV